MRAMRRRTEMLRSKRPERSRILLYRYGPSPFLGVTVAMLQGVEVATQWSFD